MSRADHADPYLAWAKSQNFAGYSAARQSGLVPLLLKVSADQFGRLLSSGIATIPGAYTATDHFITAMAKPSTLQQVEALVNRMELCIPVPVAPGTRAVPAGAKATDSKPVIAVIDRGCAVLNACFRKFDGGTRFLGLWQQAVEPHAAPWVAPSELGYGRELLPASIDQALASADASAGNEAAEYRQLGLLLDEGGTGVRVFAHGTHVLDTAAGRILQSALRSSAKPASDDAASEAPLIFVDVPELGPGDTCGASSSAFLLDALKYIRLRAGSGSPVVVNISLGALAGPHDGTSLVEEAIDDFLQTDGLMTVILAAGNAGDVLVCPWHASGRLDAKHPQAKLHWRLRPDDPTDSFVEVWLRSRPAGSKEFPRELTVALYGPDGSVTRSTQNVAVNARAAVVTRAAGSVGQDSMALIALTPCAGPRRGAPAGIWTIQIESSGDDEWEFDAWIQRDEPVWNGRTPVQSFFESVEGAAKVSAQDTLNSLGTGREVLLAMARSRESKEPTTYSSQGPGSKSRGRPTRGRASFIALADESDRIVGLLASGVCSGSTVRMGGTSVAAPVAARYIFNKIALQTSRPRARTGASGSSQRLRPDFGQVVI